MKTGSAVTAVAFAVSLCWPPALVAFILGLLMVLGEAARRTKDQ